MKITVYLFVFLFATATFQAQAQSPKAVSLNENFDNVALPAGWTIIDSLTDSHTWEFVNTYLVSYTLDGTPFALVNSDAAGAVAMSEQLISPTYNLASNNLVIIEFDQYFHYFGGGGSETGNVDVWNGSAWVNVYSATADAGTWGTPDHQYINATAYKNANFKVRFYYKGANNDYWWAIDNVKIWDPQPNDVGIKAMTAPVDGFGMTNEQISVVVKNYGTSAQTSIPVSYQVDGGSVVNETLNSAYSGFTSLAPGAEFTYTFSATYDFSAIATYNVKTWTGLGTDTDHANDTMNTPVTNSPALVQSVFPLQNGTFGVETDGNYYYVSYYTTPGKFGRYTLAGAFVDTFRITACTVGIRDMAYDPTTGHFFGGAGTPTIYELALDSVTPTLIGTVSTPTTVRYIAYDHVRDGFWVGNVTGDIYLVNKTGATMTGTGVVNPILNSSLTGLSNRYGIAFDDWSCPSEYLWVFCQPGSPSNIFLAEVDVYTGLPTGRSVDLSTQLYLTGTVPAAAGLFTHPDLVSGTVSVGGLITGANTGADASSIFIVNLQAVHPDKPFVVDGIFPADGAVQVHLNHYVALWASEPWVLNDTSLITITDGVTPVVIDSVVIAGDTVKLFHPDFQGETTYHVTFGAGTMTGLCLDNEDYTWSFTTGAVGVSEETMEVLNLYPNPASDAVIVANEAGSVWRLFTLTGRCADEQQITENMQQISLSNIPEGLYMVEITANGVRKVQKLIISR